MGASGRCAVLIALALGFCGAQARAGELWPDLAAPPGALGGGEKDAAVIVGAENYAFVAKVPGAVRNADAWQAYLTDTLKVPTDRVALLRDNEATDSKMRRFAAQMASAVEPGGTLWFVFIGHGAPAKDGKDGLLVGVDAQQDVDGLYGRSLPRAELLGLLSRGRQARTVVLLDACFSGRSSSGEALVSGLQPLILARSQPEVYDARTILLSAARSDQFAGPLPRSVQKRPAFSYLVLGALRGWAADAAGKVRAAAVVDFARRALSLDKGRTQTPELTVGASDAVLGLGREKSPDLARIDREGGAAGPEFQVSALAEVPKAEAPKELDRAASGADLGSVDVDALEKYDAAVKADNSGSSAEEKAAQWRRLAQEAPRFADLAGQRAARWERFAAEQQAAEEAKAQRLAARDADWKKLSRLLVLDVVPGPDKIRWADRFAQAYKENPGLEPDMAKTLAPYLHKGEEQAGKAGIVWVRIPGGSFMMGTNDPLGSMDDDLTGPRHRVRIKTFELAKTMVTNRQYKACVEAGACSAAKDFGPAFAGDEQPAVGVDWDQARAFSLWAGGRLPSEAEWDYAARSAGKHLRNPWGDEKATCQRAVVGLCSHATLPVCSKPEGNTEQGLCDMVGNAWEWVQDWYHSDYRGAPADGSAWQTPTRLGRVIRGSSWSNGGLFARCRNPYDPPFRQNDVGFRPARDILGP